MSTGGEGRAAFRQTSAELVVAALFFLLGGIVIYDSWRLGAGWSEDGPQAGYFPFYIGLLVCAASAVNFGQALLAKRDREKAFVEVGALKLVLSVLVPAAVYARSARVDRGLEASASGLSPSGATIWAISTTRPAGLNPLGPKVLPMSSV